METGVDLTALAGWMDEQGLGDGAITGARWTGHLAPERFVELGIIAVNPKAGGELTFSATQRFADGSIVRWSGPAGSATPAPRVILKAAAH